MKRGLFLCSLLFINLQIVSAQELFTIEDHSVTADEFKYVYNKNSFNSEEAYTKKDIKSYFELYVNFKLKVHHAKQIGLDTISSLINEFNSYKEQLQKPYLHDESLEEKLIDQAYERMKEEVHASHILIRTTESDTAQAWKKIQEIEGRLSDGESFAELARETSEDPSARQNNGDLGYFSSMMMVYPFENAAYNTPVGEVSAPVKTRFGYHLIKVHDRRENMGKVEVAHIMLRFPRNMTAAQRAEKKEKIDQIYQEVVSGADFFEMAKLYSEDPTSKSNGGRIRPFGVSAMPPPFGEISFDLSIDSISKPFATDFGWHIVKKLNTIGLPPKEEMYSEIAMRVSSDGRSQIQEQQLIERLKKENGFEIFTKSMNALADGNNLAGEEILFKVGDREVLMDDYNEFLAKRTSTPSLMESFIGEQIIKFEEDMLPKKYPEFRYLLNEYREGILLFQIMNDKVWNKAAEDTVGLNQFFQNNRNDYVWKKRAEGLKFTTQDASTADSIQAFLEEYNGLATDSLLKLSESELSGLFQLKKGPFEKDSEDLSKEFEWSDGIQKQLINDTYFVFYITDIKDPGQKQLNEVRGNVIADYQDSLDEEWIDELRKTYEVDINKKTYKNVIKDLKK